MGNIQMSNLNSVEIIQITNTKNLHTINLPKTQAIERVNIINTIGLHNFSSNAKTVRHATFLHNTDLKGIELLQLKFSVSLRHNIALKSLKLQSLESGGVMIKNCKNLNKVSVPKFKRGHLTLIGNPQLSAIITKRNKSRTTLMVSNCSKLNGTEIDVQLNEARNHCKSSNSSSLFHLITCAMIKNLVNSQ
ncbi:uncharacterized protein LOC135120708 isoform X2 [Zophobas morio]|uniref:uncharacterized protein LOC135120708 isoform X2 n=1 Tax=Zophobas morio TaxID=2755281 RepID=UPI0030834EEE